MLFNITKHTGKPHVISYTRNNGSITWMYADDFFVQHDLCHYAIESTLSYRTAFNGMLNEGMDIKDFEDREKRATIPLTAEAAYAESMANLFLMEVTQGPCEDFNAMQQSAFATAFGNRFPVPTLTGEQIGNIREALRSLLRQWHQLPAGETLSLTFDL